MFSHCQYNFQKNSALTTGVSEKTVRAVRQLIRETITTYSSLKPVKVGGLIKNKPIIAYHDVTFACNYFFFF